MNQRSFNLINPLFLRSMLCGLRLRHAIKAGASRPSLVSHPPERRFPHGREFNKSFFFFGFLVLSKSLSMVMLVSNWSLDAFGEAVHSGE